MSTAAVPISDALDSWHHPNIVAAARSALQRLSEVKTGVVSAVMVL
jgi:hypothetical protein